ncbi:MAG: phosphoribosylformylglycinamidine synthase subunit PurL, partial [Nitrosopumilus sp.]|nr:phosphoribosylformylglycinamidine synthase subunit PurL [Nitrosopumilus sp.]
KILFSESHSRYLITLENNNLQKLEETLKKHGVSYSLIGEFIGDSICFTGNSKSLIDLSVDKAHKTWFNSLKEMVLHA